MLLFAMIACTTPPAEPPPAVPSPVTETPPVATSAIAACTPTEVPIRSLTEYNALPALKMGVYTVRGYVPPVPACPVCPPDARCEECVLTVRLTDDPARGYADPPAPGDVQVPLHAMDGVPSTLGTAYQVTIRDGVFASLCAAP
jgi:hypothetical protein